MVVYRNNSKAPLKWLVAVIIFILALSITWSDVEGIEIGSGRQASVYQDRAPMPTRPDVSTSNLNYSSDVYYISSTTGNNPGVQQGRDINEPTAAPEPGSLVLLGTGLAAIYLRTKKILSS